MLLAAKNDTNLGELLLTHVPLLAGVAVAGQLTALETVAGAVVAPLRVDTVVLGTVYFPQVPHHGRSLAVSLI